MQHLFKTLKNRLAGNEPKNTFTVTRPQEFQVLVPGSVNLPLPRSPREEISLPASINGRDLSTGRL